MAVDEAKLNDLLGRFVTDVGGAFHAVSAVIGDRLGLYAGLEALRLAGYLLYPYTPNVSARIAEQLGVEAPASARWSDVGVWGAFKPGGRVKTGTPLFPRLMRDTP